MLIWAAIALRMNALLLGSWFKKSANSSSTLKATTAVFGDFCVMLAVLGKAAQYVIMILRLIPARRKLGRVLSMIQSLISTLLCTATALSGSGAAFAQTAATNNAEDRVAARVLYVAVPELPENLSPATAWTTAERAALDLLFSRLVQVRLEEPPGQRYETDLAAKLPERDGLHLHAQLREDRYWSDGERVTAADVRHTAYLLRATSTWRDLVEVPRFDGLPLALDFTLRHGLMDPYAPLNFYVLPQKYRGQSLSRADDADFAKAPVGSGPFVYMGRKQEGNTTVAVFGANPHFRANNEAGTVREVRMIAWKDVSFAKKPTPQLLLDGPQRTARCRQANRLHCRSR